MWDEELNEEKGFRASGLEDNLEDLGEPPEDNDFGLGEELE